MTERLQSIKRSIVSSKKNRMEEVRARTKLNAKQLKDLLFGSDNHAKYIQPIFDFIEQNRTIFTHHNIENHNRKEQRKEAAKMIMAYMKFVNIDLEQDPLKLAYSFYAFAAFDNGLSVKANLHYFLYIKTILLYQNKPVHKEFLEKAKNLEDLGCFGLTQFNHGSFSQGIQTLAVYDHASKSFNLTTQGTKGMKYWIGAAAEIANMCVIWAQLIVNGKSQGPFPFLVQLRCKKTHKVLPQITIGDCGPKNGLNYIDNGYIMIDNLKIPKQNLLGKLGDVDDNGIFVSAIENSSRRFGFHMSALSGGRGLLSFICNGPALNTLAIALRYSCSRKQFDNPQKNDEILIIDYSLTKLRIIPNLAQTILQLAPGRNIGCAYFGDSSIFANSDYISQLHALSASLKARTSWNTTSTANDCRSILGGHGYSAYSRISSIYHDLDVNTTWEGDNNLLLQQTSKYLMNTVEKRKKTSILDISFVWNQQKVDFDKIAQSLRSIDNIEILMRGLLTQKYNNALLTFNNLSSIHKISSQVWLNFHSQAGNTLSLNYAQYYIFTVSKQKILAAKNEQNKNFLTKCLYLWAFSIIEKERYGSLELRKQLQKEIVILCDELVEPSIVALDILAPSSFIIGSPFANKDGDGLKEYLTLLYSSKDTFTRVPYYQELIEAKKRQL